MLAALFLLLLPASLDVYVGEYSLVPAESADMRRVVEDTASRLNFLIRPIARTRLRKTQVAFPSLQIIRNGEEFRLRHEAGTDVTHRGLDTPVSAVSPDGSKIQVRLIAGPPLVESYDSGDGLRVNTYRLSLDGAKLTLDVRITSSRLPKPIEYKLVYARVPKR